MDITLEDEMRFWEKVDIQDEKTCWNWSGCLSQGYGVIHMSLDSVILYRAHRLSLYLETGIIGIQANHKCNNRKC